MRELAFAVVGTGFWGQFQTAAWKEVPRARLVALCDRDVARASDLAQKHGIPRVYGDAEEMLRSENLDFVDIAASPEAHCSLVHLAASHRIPVICQKPMALDFASCERMVQECRKAGITFLVHENYRWQTPMRRAHELLSQNRIGRPFRAHIQFSHGDIQLFDNQPYLYSAPHFAMFDMGPHLLDLARFFFGEPQGVYAREFKMHPRLQGEDIVSIFLSSPQMACHCELSWRTTGYELFVEGTEGTLTWDPKGQLTLEMDHGKISEDLAPVPYAWADPLYGFAHSSIVNANRNLLAGLRGECPAETTGEDNLKTMWLLHLALESARTSQALRV